MANELNAFASSGLTAYAVLLNSVGQIWNGSTFVTINGANWTSYDIALTEGTAGIYLGNMPAAAAGEYSFIAFKQAGANPTITDKQLGSGWISWDGTNEILLSDLALQASVDDLEGRLTAIRAGYLDNLSGGAVATAASIAALNDLSADDVHDEVVEGSLTFRQIIRILLSVLAGKSTGGGTTTIAFRDYADAKNRVSATVDDDGNRDAITLDGS